MDREKMINSLGLIQKLASKEHPATPEEVKLTELESEDLSQQGLIEMAVSARDNKLIILGLRHRGETALGEAVALATKKEARKENEGAKRWDILKLLLAGIVGVILGKIL